MIKNVSQYYSISRFCIVLVCIGFIFIAQSCGPSEECSNPIYNLLDKKSKSKVHYTYGQKISFLHTDSISNASDTVHLIASDTGSLYYAISYPNYPNCTGDFYEHKRFIFNVHDKNELETGILIDQYDGINFYIKFNGIVFQENIAVISNDPNYISTFIQYNVINLSNKIKVVYSVSKGIMLIENLTKHEKWTLIQ